MILPRVALLVGPRARVEAEVARGPEAVRRGLTGRAWIPADHGMLLDLGARGPHRFTLRGVPIPLDVLPIDDGAVVQVLEGLPAWSEGPYGGVPCSAALEVNAGWCRRHGVRVGDRVTLADTFHNARELSHPRARPTHQERLAALRAGYEAGRREEARMSPTERAALEAWRRRMGRLVEEACAAVRALPPSPAVGQAAPSSSVVTHAQAREILRRAWQEVHARSPSQEELALLQAVALLETGYGRLGQFAELARRGIYNWGALQRVPGPGGACPPGTVLGLDARRPRCFYAHRSDLEAATAFVRTLTVSYPARATAVLRALASGSPEQVARAMRVAPAFYEASEASYAAAIRGALGRIGAVLPASAVRSVGPAAGRIALALGAGAGAYWLLRRARPTAARERRRTT